MVATWQRLAYVTLGSAGDVLDTANDSSFSGNDFEGKKHLKVHIFTVADGGNTNHAIRYNGLTTSILAYRRNQNGGSDATPEANQSSDPCISASLSSDTMNTFAVGNIINILDKEKMQTWDTVFGENEASNSPERREGVNKMTTTDAQITRISVTNDVSGSNYGVGSSITVWGADDQPSTPFYPNIPNGAIFEESDTGKHYMFDGTDTWNEMT